MRTKKITEGNVRNNETTAGRDMLSILWDVASFLTGSHSKGTMNFRGNGSSVFPLIINAVIDERKGLIYFGFFLNHSFLEKPIFCRNSQKGSKICCIVMRGCF